MKKLIALVLCATLMLTMVVSAQAAATILRPGARGTAVRQVQKALNDLGYAELSVDGVYGKATADAVRQFQSMNHLRVDGIAGPKTLNALLGSTTIDNDPTPGATVGGTTLRKGATGPSVRELQTLLRQYGYKDTPIDGAYGDETVAAVRSFQKLNNLVVDGIAGSKTLAALKSGSAVAFYVPKTYTKLKHGMTGLEVVKLQQKLASLGYVCAVTGYFNQETFEAVSAYQLLNGLRVDGIAGQQTQASMFGK